ncbi:fimbrial protein [Pantoea stewartii]|uniref:fimbrial protein n=1 Tax=Pantoea stewartii TaxID=66269 RepID=UPI0019804A84|nr:fimbrial protein [Pantoea stewartii]
MLIASNNIQSIGNHGTTTPNIVSPFLSDFGNSNIIFLMSEMINPQVLIYSASAGKYGALYFPVHGTGVINAGDTLFTVTYNSSVALANTRDSGFNVVISFVAANRSVIVQRNCDFSSQSTSVNLPEYSVAGMSAFPVGLSLSCTAGSDVGITMNLTGTTLSDDNTVFTSDGSAQGVGVRFYYNSQPVAANQELQAGYVNGNNVPTNLGLSVAYARTSGRLTAGTVRSRVNLTLTYR